MEKSNEENLLFPLQFEKCVEQCVKNKDTNDFNKIALIYEEEGVVQNITYEQLNQRINRLSYCLLKNQFAPQKDGRGKLVAIFVSEMPHFIECLLAVWKTGAAYVPISLKEKYQVIKDTLDSSQPDIYLSFEQLKNDYGISQEKLIITKDLKLDDYSIENPVLQPEICPDDLAYVMYTSGSTGKPKGAAILHRGIPYCVKAHQDIMNLKNTDHIAQMARVGFDASLMEILMALGTGATLCIVPSSTRDDNDELIKFFTNHEVTQAIFVPSKLKTLNPTDFPKLKGLIVTGEAFEEKLIKPWHDIEKKIINGYGLTETTICTTLGLYEVGKKLNIGLPIKGTQIHLIPNREEIVENDLCEFYVSGASVAKEYWRDPERTQERFKEIEVEAKKKDSDIKEIIKVRAYRTGDKGKLVEDEVDGKKYSYYLYYGRIDNQLKLRGQRLEPEHIEAKLKAFEVNSNKIIQDAYVVGAQKGDDLHLVAYLIKNSAYKEEVSFETIREYLKACLPGFMVPNAMDWLDDTKDYVTKDKMDRKKLSDHSGRPIPFIHTKDIELPKTEDEKEIAFVWADILGYDKGIIKRKDDFFCLGGSSVKVSELLSRLRNSERFIKRANKVQELQDEHIYECSSLKEMSRLILPSCLYQINISASDNHIYFVHSLIGDGPTDYNSIVKGLPDYKPFAFRARALDHKEFAEGALDTLNELAADYVSQLLFKHKKSRKPNQPIVLIGWSSGGLIALEMAKQLKKKYEKEPWVILLDTDYPREMKNNDIAYLGKTLAKQIFKKEIFEKDIEEIILSGNSFEVKVREVFERLNKLPINMDEAKTKQLNFAKWLFLAEHEYAKNWNEVNLDKEKIKVILAEKSFNDNQNTWSNFAKVVLKGTNHFDLIKDSKCKDELSKYLQEIQYEEEFKKLITKLKQKHLKSITRKQILSEEKWVVTAENYLPVQLVENKLLDTEKKIDELKENSIDYSDLFSEAGVTLIQGPAGSGKTLLTEFLAQQAAKSKLWGDKNFDVVLRLPLRRLPNYIKGNIELAQVIYYEYFGEIVDKDLLKILEKFLIKRQATIAWILDGFDEVATYYLASFDTPMKLFLRKLFQQKHLIITARPEFKDELTAKTVLINKGLDDINIKKYIDTFFVNSAECAEFFNWHKQHNSLEVLANPIVLELTCNLWQFNRTKTMEAPATITELYSRMSTTLLDHHWLHRCARINSHPHFKPAIKACLALLAYKATQTGCRGLISGELLQGAYEEIKQQHDERLKELQADPRMSYLLVETLTTIQLEQQDWLEYVEKCPFLRQVQNGTTVRERTYEFIHLSFQDYWTADYLFNNINITNLPTLEFNDISKLVQVHTETGDHEAILIFLAGRLREKPQLLEAFINVVVNDPTIKPPTMSTDKTRLLLSMVCWEESQCILIDQTQILLNSYIKYYKDLIDFDSRGDSDIESFIQSLLFVFCGHLNRCPQLKQQVESHLQCSTNSKASLRQIHANMRLSMNTRSILGRQQRLTKQLLALICQKAIDISSLLQLIGYRFELAQDILVKNLTNDDLNICQLAAESLLKYGKESGLVIKALVKVVKSKDAILDNRQAAAERLLQYGKESELVNALVSILKAKDTTLGDRQDAVNLWWEYGKESESVNALVSILKAKDTTLGDWQDAVNLWWEYGKESEFAIQALDEIFETKDTTLRDRQNTVNLLLRHGEENELAIQALVEMLKAKDATLGNRQAAAERLLQYGKESELAIQALVEIIKAKDTKLGDQQAAANLLLKYGKESELVNALVEILKAKDTTLGDRQAAANLLLKYGKEVELAIQALVEIIKAKDTRLADRRAAANLLLKYGKESELAIQALVEIIKAKDTRLADRRATANLLLEYGKESELAIQALVEMLKAKDTALGKRQAAALLEYGKESELPIPALVEIIKVKETELWVRRVVANLLLRYGKESELVNALVEILKAKDTALGDRQVAANLLLKYGKESELVNALVEILKAKDTTLGDRQAAANLLLKYGKEVELAIQALVEIIKAKDTTLGDRQDAANLLLKYGKEVELAIQALVEIIKAKDMTFGNRFDAANLLLRYSNESEPHELDNFYNDETQFINKKLEPALKPGNVNAIDNLNTIQDSMKDSSDLSIQKKRKAQICSPTFFSKDHNIDPPYKRSKSNLNNNESISFNSDEDVMPIEELSLQDLMNLTVNIIPQDKDSVSVLFDNLTLAENFKRVFLSASFGESVALNVVKENNMIDKIHYKIILTAAEYNRIMGEGAFEVLILAKQNVPKPF